MPFLTYAQVRPWAKSIRAAVASKAMPPWFADAGVGHFANDRSLTSDQIAKIVSWVDAGAPEGDAREHRTGPGFQDGWNMPVPDVVLGMRTPFKIAANSTIEYQYVVIPTNFTEDKWIRSVEVRPSDRSVVHHAQVFIREPGSRWMRRAEPYVPFTPDPERSDITRLNDDAGGGSQTLAIYTPGAGPAAWAPGVAKRIPVGSDIVIQLHYTSAKEDRFDQTKLGLVFAKEAPAQQSLTLVAGNVRFKIPARNPNYAVKGTQPIPSDGYLIRFFPHMHLRGKGFEFFLVDGDKRTPLLKVDNFNFNWQLTYDLAEPIPLKRGMEIQAVAVFDNSANNRFNPDPNVNVTWGEQSWNEMAQGFFEIAVDARHTFDSWIHGRPVPTAAH